MTPGLASILAQTLLVLGLTYWEGISLEGISSTERCRVELGEGGKDLSQGSRLEQTDW